MTTYTAISATETQSGKPITESLMTRFANNCLAIQEGDPTAPPIKKEAFEVGELFVMDSVQSTSAPSLTYDHGDTVAHDVHIYFSATFFKYNGSATFALVIDGSTIYTGAITDQAGDWSIAGGRTVSLGAGSHTIAVTFSGITSSIDATYLSAVAFKR